MAFDHSTESNRQSIVILASQSPRRQELLRQIGIPFQILDHSVDEIRLSDESPDKFVQRMAREKVKSVQCALPADRNAVVLGADTAVICGDQIMGKPADRDEACLMLAELSGREHRVISAVAVGLGTELAESVSETVVKFKPLSRGEIEHYCDTGEPFDKAGAYAIQGLGGVFVEHITGSYSGVVGLPLFETALLLNRFGVRCWQDASSLQADQQ